MHIAAFVDDHGMVASLRTKGWLNHYAYKSGNWVAVSINELDLQALGGIREFRLAVEGMQEILEPCRQVVVGEVRGTPCAVLSSLGYTLWESKAPVEQALEEIRLFEERRKAIQAKPEAPKIPAPQTLGDPAERRFRIDLASIMDSGRHIPSKDILIPFLHKGDFQSLEVICHKAPCWMETELPALGYGISEATGPDLLTKLTITKGQR